MICTTRDFGEIEINEQEIINFVQPPFGFDEYSKYALLFDGDTDKSIAWLQSIEEPNVCFIVFDPDSFVPNYQPEFAEKDLQQLGDGEVVCWIIAVVPEDFKQTTVNLKSPIIINTHSKQAAQVILEQDFSVRHQLIDEVTTC